MEDVWAWDSVTRRKSASSLEEKSFKQEVFRQALGSEHEWKPEKKSAHMDYECIPTHTVLSSLKAEVVSRWLVGSSELRKLMGLRLQSMKLGRGSS